MYRMHRHALLAALVGGFVVLSSTACGDENGLDNEDFTAELTADVGAAQTDEVEEATVSLQFQGAVPAVVGPPMPSIIALRPWLGACATITGTADSDGDGVPNQAVFTFALPACEYDGIRGGSVAITGTVTLSDPTPETSDFSARLLLDDLRFAYTNLLATRTYATTRNGTRALTASTSSATLVNAVTTVRTHTGRANATIENNTTLTFTPAQGQTLVRGAPLPDGTIAATGTIAWKRNGRGREFTVTTQVPLQWDADCTTDRKISQGEIRWTLSNGSYIKTVWSGCGEDPTHTFVEAS